MPRRQFKKLLVKLKDPPKWVHFCWVSASLYDEFFQVLGIETSEITKYLRQWAKGDFSFKLKLDTWEELQTLRQQVNRIYQQDYMELYSLSEEENPYIKGWVRLWVAQHMRIEIQSRKEEVGPHAS